VGVINVGAAAQNRASYRPATVTYINCAAAANASGYLDTVKVYMNADATGLKVGVFYLVSPLRYTTRSYASLGDALGGGVRTFTGLNLAIVVGDLIGIYFAAGRIESDTSGGAGVDYKAGDQIPCANALFASYTANVQSFNGSGVYPEAVPGPLVAVHRAIPPMGVVRLG